MIVLVRSQPSSPDLFLPISCADPGKNGSARRTNSDKVERCITDHEKECNINQFLDFSAIFSTAKTGTMKPTPKIPFMLIVIAASLFLSARITTGERDYYQLKIYRFESADQEARLDRYLEHALLPALHRAGTGNVGVFKLRDEGNEEQNAIFILIPFRSLDQIDALPGILREDGQYLQEGRDYIGSPHDNPPYARIESILLKAFSESPQLIIPHLESPRTERVYELRSYLSATEQLHERKVEMFNQGESELFRKLGFSPVFFGEVISSADMPHLMYMTVHADTTAQKEHWAAFGSHPEWQEMVANERYQNTVSHIDRVLLYPTPYSDY
jgi:hypothetical protein